MLRWLVIAVVCGACALLAWVFFVREDVHGDLTTKLVFDDFGFQVVESHETATLGDGSLKPAGTFRVVQLRVYNDAKRVDYRVAQHRAVLFDASGQRYEIDRAATQALEAALAPSARSPEFLHAGEQTVQNLAFDVPRGSKCELAVSFGGWFVDGLDWILLGERRIRLP